MMQVQAAGRGRKEAEAEAPPVSRGVAQRGRAMGGGKSQEVKGGNTLA